MCPIIHFLQANILWGVGFIFFLQKEAQLGKSIWIEVTQSIKFKLDWKEKENKLDEI